MSKSIDFKSSWLFNINSFVPRTLTINKIRIMSLKSLEASKVLSFSPPRGGWKLAVLPGGRMPEFKTSGAGAVDLYTRAIVSTDSDPCNPALRKTIYDFSSKIPQNLKNNVERNGRAYVYMLYPGESVRIGVGIAIELPRIQVAYIHPRGSTSNKQLELYADDEMKIQVKNGAVPIDSDYRGEPSAVIYNNGDQPFEIFRHKRIVQLVRNYVAIDLPSDLPLVVASVNDLSSTGRQFGQNGSSGFGK